MIPTDEGRTEADAAIDNAAKPQVFTEGHTRHLVAPPGWTALATEDIEDEQAAPYRITGTTTVDNQESFVAAVTMQSPRTSYLPVVYSQTDKLRVLAVLNHSQVTDPASPQVEVSGENEQVVPGWGDHRVALQLRRSDEWQTWINANGKYTEQDKFAEFIEDRIDDIVSSDPRFPAEGSTPSQAEMLEISRTFQATMSARFERRVTLQSGKRNLTYNEDQSASAGETGQLQIPEQFSIAVRPFYGSERAFVRVRLRYRVEKEHLSLGIQLIRPDLIEEAIYNDEVEAIADALHLTVIEGTPPGN